MGSTIERKKTGRMLGENGHSVRKMVNFIVEHSRWTRQTEHKKILLVARIGRLYAKRFHVDTRNERQGILG